MVQTRQSRKRKRKIPKALVKLLYFAILTIPFIALSILISSVSRQSSSLSMKALYLSNELLFSSTFRECIDVDTKKCKQYIPSGTSRQRIAVLAPPGKAVDEYFKILKNALITFYGSEEKMNQELDVFQTSHVPPYGYGKTHGMTKIVRIVNGPLMNQAIEAISKVDQTDISSSDGSSNTHILSGVIQQMIRWHCRLNHVSAHTFMYNVHLDYKNLIDLTSILVRFIVSDVGKSFSEDFRHLDQMKQVDAYVTTAIKRLSNHDGFISGSRLSERIMQRLEAVLMKELNDTKNLTNWPCMGFWDVQDIDSPVVKGIATELVPDCKAQYTQCSVKKDLCEEKGIKDCFK